MPGSDPADWLHRLTASEWVAAARAEAMLCEQALSARSRRTGVTHARRAAGMALNALLVERLRPQWGRSYMEHLAGLSTDEAAPEEVRAAARRLCEVRATSPALVQLGKSAVDLEPLEAARALLAWVEAERFDQLSMNG